jgi:hypothetical protein
MNSMEFYYTLIAYEVKFGASLELRVFLASDLPRGQELAKLFTDVGLHVDVKDLSVGASSGKGRPNTFELWFGTAAVPASCAG